MIIIQDYVVIFKEDFAFCSSQGISNGKVIALYCKIKSMAQQKGFCRASNAYFADFLSCSTRQITRYLTELEQAELISMHFKKKGNHTDYREMILDPRQPCLGGIDNIGNNDQNCLGGIDNIGRKNQNCLGGWTTLSRGIDNIGKKNQNCLTSNIIAGSVSPKVTKEHIFNIIDKYNLNKNLIKNMIILLNQNVEDINKNEKVSGNYNFSEEEFKLLEQLAREGKL